MTLAFEDGTANSTTARIAGLVMAVAGDAGLAAIAVSDVLCVACCGGHERDGDEINDSLANHYERLLSGWRLHPQRALPARLRHS